jgi:hypothetical protein
MAFSKSGLTRLHALQLFTFATDFSSLSVFTHHLVPPWMALQDGGTWFASSIAKDTAKMLTLSLVKDAAPLAGVVMCCTSIAPEQRVCDFF